MKRMLRQKLEISDNPKSTNYPFTFTQLHLHKRINVIEFSLVTECGLFSVCFCKRVSLLSPCDLVNCEKRLIGVGNRHF